MRDRVTLTRPPARGRRPAPLPAIDLAPARIELPTRRPPPVDPGRPRTAHPELGEAPAPREGLGPEEPGDWLLHGLFLIAVYAAYEVLR